MKTIIFAERLAEHIEPNKEYNVSDHSLRELLKSGASIEIVAMNEAAEILSQERLPITEMAVKSFKQSKKASEETILEEIYEMARALANDGILFDDTKVLWRFNEEKHIYELCDQTDLQNIVLTKVNIFSALNPQYRVAFELAIKMIARDRSRVICADAEQKYKYSIQFRDTLYNGITLEQRKVTKNDFVHNSIPHSPKDVATPVLDKLFDQWTSGKGTQLKDILAYSCIPNNTQKLIFFYLGQRNSGKSQFMGVMKKFLGEANCVSTNLGILADQSQRFELINLRNKLAAFVSEIDEKTTYNTAMLKRLSGNDDLRGEYKGVNGTIPFRFGGKVHIITNSLPTVADENDYAYFARTVIIEFPNTFENTDIEILDTVPNEEYAGLAHYCLNRVKEWYGIKSIKISHLEPVDLRAKKYLKHTDLLGSFVSANMELHEDFEENTDFRINSNEFASLFNEFLLKNGQKEWDVRRIGRSLFEKYPKQIFKTKKRFGEITVWEYRGIRIREKQQTLDSVPIVPIVPIVSTPIPTHIKQSETSRNNRNNRNTRVDCDEENKKHDDKPVENSTPLFPLEIGDGYFAQNVLAELLKKGVYFSPMPGKYRLVQ
jgi:phage/plasmid-associated DNA primase